MSAQFWTLIGSKSGRAAIHDEITLMDRDGRCLCTEQRFRRPCRFVIPSLYCGERHNARSERYLESKAHV